MIATKACEQINNTFDIGYIYHHVADSTTKLFSFLYKKSSHKSVGSLQMVGAIKEPSKITTIISDIPRMRKVKNKL